MIQPRRKAQAQSKWGPAVGQVIPTGEGTMKVEQHISRVPFRLGTDRALDVETRREVTRHSPKTLTVSVLVFWWEILVSFS